MSKVIARSASDRTDDWPFWMLWDGVKNVTAETLDRLGIQRPPGAVFLTRKDAEAIASRIAE
jgi:hypothetical protein